MGRSGVGSGGEEIANQRMAGEAVFVLRRMVLRAQEMIRIVEPGVIPTASSVTPLSETATPSATPSAIIAGTQQGSHSAYHLAAFHKQDVSTETPTPEAPAETDVPAETQAAATETQVPASTDTPAPESTSTDTPAASQTPAMPSATPAVTETATATLMTSATPTATVTATPTATRSGLLSAMAMSLSGVSQPQTIRYVYDGDGNLVLSIVDDVRTYYPGKHFDQEVAGSITTVKKYYSLSGQTVAVRTVQGETDTLNWILNDHLGSASITAAADGSKVAELRYSAFGEIRFSSGTTPPASAAPTEYQYTGQLNAEAGLIFYNARFYDPVTTHFAQADVIIPNTSIATSYDRYSYVLNNPIRLRDPSGHKECEGVYSCTTSSKKTTNNATTTSSSPHQVPISTSILTTIAVSTPFTFAAAVVYAAVTMVFPKYNQPVRTPGVNLPIKNNDMTNWLVGTLNKSSSSVRKAFQPYTSSLNLIERAVALKAWIALVRTGGQFDYKTDILKYHEDMNVQKDSDIIIGGKTLNFQSVANIAYGYVGRAAGYSNTVLESGAGAFQIYDNGIKKGSWNAVGPVDTYFDDPADNYMIRFGEWLYDQTGGNQVVPWELTKDLNKYSNCSGIKADAE